MSNDADDEDEVIEASVTAASEEIIPASRTTDPFCFKVAPVGPANSILKNGRRMEPLVSDPRGEIRHRSSLIPQTVG
jgi:hypothetical protein